MIKKLYIKKVFTCAFYIGVNILGLPILFTYDVFECKKERNINQRYSY
jgi:hypothetical protein